MSPELAEQLLDAAAKIGRYDRRDPFALLGMPDESAQAIATLLVAGGYHIVQWEILGYVEGWHGHSIGHSLSECDSIDHALGFELGERHRFDWASCWSEGPRGAAITPLCTREGVPHELREELARQQREGEATDFLCTQCGYLYPDDQGADNDVSDLCICNDCYAENEGT